MTKRLLVHAGFHKTGTSYIQSLFQANRERLLEAGIWYPPLRKENHSLFVAWSRKNLSVGFQKQSDWLERRFEEADTVLISSEEFSSDFNAVRRVKHYSGVFEPYEVTILLYLRRHDHFLESVFSQISKGHFLGTIEELPNVRGRFFDFLNRLEPIVETFGSNRIVLRPYNPLLWRNGDIAQDALFHLTGLDIKGLKTPQRTNESMSRRKTLFLASLAVDKPTRKAVAAAIRNVSSIRDDGVKFCASPEFLSAFYETHRDANQRLLSIFGIDGVDEFFGYDGQSEQGKWFPAEPLSQSEIEGVRQDLIRAGLDADTILSSSTAIWGNRG